MKNSRDIKIKIIHSKHEGHPQPVHSLNQLLRREEASQTVENILYSHLYGQSPRNQQILQQSSDEEWENLLPTERTVEKNQDGMFTIRELDEEEIQQAEQNNEASLCGFSTIKPKRISQSPNQQEIWESLENVKGWKITEPTLQEQTTKYTNHIHEHCPNINAWEDEEDESIREEEIPIIDESPLILQKMIINTKKNTLLRPDQRIKSRMDLLYDCSEEQLKQILQILEGEGIYLVKTSNQRKQLSLKLQKQNTNSPNRKKRNGIKLTPKAYTSNFISRQLLERSRGQLIQ